MNERPNNAPPEDRSSFLKQAGVPQSVFFYIILGVISGARKLLGKTIHTGCPTEITPGVPAPTPGLPRGTIPPKQS
jgi:hypothetical protein